MGVLENENNLLEEKELKIQETIKNLLEKTDTEVKEEDVHDNAMKNEGENKHVFVDLDSDSDYGMKHGLEVDSDDSLIVINSECKTPKKKFKSSSDSICSSTMVILCDNDVSNKNYHTQLPSNSNKESKSRYKGRIPSSEEKHHALERAEQLQKIIRNPSYARPMTLSGSHWFTLAKKFCMDSHLPDHDTEMILECKDGAKYEVKYIGRRNAFSQGMSNFARALSLELGDVLVFELTSSTQFKVHIVKAIQEV